MRDYQIACPRSGSVICNHKFHSDQKLHDTKCNFHVIIFILKSKNRNITLFTNDTPPTPPPNTSLNFVA